MKRHMAWITAKENTLYVEEIDATREVLGGEATDWRGRYYYSIGDTETQARYNLRNYIKLKTDYMTKMLETLNKSVRRD